MANMANSIGLDIHSRPVSEKVKRDEIYLDSKAAPSLVDEMNENLKNISYIFEEMCSNLDKARKLKVVRGDYDRLFQKWSNKNLKQSDYFDMLSKTLKSKFDTDYSEYVIKLLSDRLAELENKINDMSDE